MTIKRRQRDRIRVVGKQGYDTKSGKVFSKMVVELEAKKRELKVLGYVVIPVVSIGGCLAGYQTIFPSGERRLLSLEELMMLP